MTYDRGGGHAPERGMKGPENAAPSLFSPQCTGGSCVDKRLKLPTVVWCLA
jgi:hypothetical protein